MPRDFQEIVITASCGSDHRYETVPLRFDDQINLKLELAEIFSDSLIELSPIVGQALAKLFGDFDFDDAGLIDIDWESAFKSIDWSRLPAAVKQLPQGVAAHGGAELIARLFAETVVYVPQDNGKPKKLHLSDSRNRDEVWSGGINQREFYRAFWWILQVNYSPFGTGGSGTFGELWEKLKASLPASVELQQEMSSQAQKNRAKRERRKLRRPLEQG
jgi:hypothetical protein